MGTQYFAARVVKVDHLCGEIIFNGHSLFILSLTISYGPLPNKFLLST